MHQALKIKILKTDFSLESDGFLDFRYTEKKSKG